MEAIFLVFGVIFGIICAAIASSKGRSVVGWFFAGFLFGWIPLVIIICLSNLKEESSYRDRQSRENRRLREQLRQERLKGEAFREHTMTRLDTHDQQLGVDTRQTYAALPMHQTDERPMLEDQASSDLDALANSAQDAAFGTQPATQPVMQRQAARPSVAAQVRPQARQWHYEMNGQAMGPVPEPQLLAMLKAGQINAATLLWTEELGDWKAASQIGALRAYLKG